MFPPHGGFADELDRFLNEPTVAARPLFAVYLVALNAGFGSHMGIWLGWLVATSVLMSLSLYLLLRKLDFDFLDAGLISGLVLIFPAASSLRFWAATAQIPVSVSLAILGFLLAFYAFEARGKRRLVLHSASLGLFVASLLFYEAAILVMLVSVLLYRLRVPWSAAFPRWVADWATLVAVAAVVAEYANEAKEVQSLAGMWDHAATIFVQGWSVLATVVLPLDSGAWYLLALIGMLPLAAGLVARRLPPNDPARSQLLRWLLVLGGGLLVVGLGYAVFIPGIDLYTPLASGNLNRVNAVPSIGWVLVLYALIMLAGTLAFRNLAGSRTLLSLAVMATSALVGAWWLAEVSRHSDAYTRAFREDERVLATIHAAIPDPLPGSTIWTFGQAIEVIPGIPVFGNTWDMTTSVQLRYDDPTIKSYVAFPGVTFDCRDDVIVPGNNASYPPAIPPSESEFASSYGRTYFIDTSTGRFDVIRTPAQCRRASDSFERGPVYLE